MKKIMSLMLGLSLFAGVATFMFAQGDTKDTAAAKKTGGKKGGKKGSGTDAPKGGDKTK
jgi:hypothetical protein